MTKFQTRDNRVFNIRLRMIQEGAILTTSSGNRYNVGVIPFSQVLYDMDDK